MNDYVYPAIFHQNDDNTFTITYPDLSGCISEGKSLNNAMYMAQRALSQWIEYSIEKGLELPPPSHPQGIHVEEKEFISLILANVKDDSTVKRTISLPRWLDTMALEDGLSLSRFVQDALKKRYDSH